MRHDGEAFFVLEHGVRLRVEGVYSTGSADPNNTKSRVQPAETTCMHSRLGSRDRHGPITHAIAAHERCIRQVVSFGGTRQRTGLDALGREYNQPSNQERVSERRSHRPADSGARPHVSLERTPT